MNCAIAHGRWQLLSGAVAAHWGFVTGNLLSVISAGVGSASASSR